MTIDKILKILEAACHSCYMNRVKDNMGCPWRDISRERCELYEEFKEKLCKEKKF